jgi:tripartite-type tricarboxylate transporter receptor subunit TctC
MFRVFPLGSFRAASLSRAALLLPCLIAALAPLRADAQAWPARPIRMIVPFPAGGALDTVGRVAAQALSDRLGVQIVVDNRGGASGVIGVSDAVRAQPDGYTLLFTSSDTITILPLLRKDLPFDVAKDITPVAKVADVYMMFAAHPGFKAQSIKELIDMAKAKPGEIRYASVGNGTVHHITFEYFNDRAGVKIAHIPFKGGAPAVTATIGGHVEMLISGVNIFKNVQNGQLRGLAVAKETRSALLPNVPTMIESGIPDFVASSWFGVFGPAGLPSAIGSRVGRELVTIAATPEFQQRVAAVGGEAGPLPQDEFVKFMASESRRWQRIIETTKVKIED